MILDIEKEWSRDPGWFFCQDHETQIDLIAHHRLSKYDQKNIKKRREKIKKSKFIKQREKYKRGGSI